jgi:hypothetical protein
MRKIVKKASKAEASKPKSRRKINSAKYLMDGIEFKSNLEGRMHELLKEAGIPNKYEGKEYVILEPISYPIECYERTPKRDAELKDKRRILAMKYTPDFVGPDPENPEFVIETKGFANESFPLRWKMFKHMVNNSGNAPMLFKPMSVADCRQVVEILKAKGYGRK